MTPCDFGIWLETRKTLHDCQHMGANAGFRREHGRIHQRPFQTISMMSGLEALKSQQPRRDPASSGARRNQGRSTGWCSTAKPQGSDRLPRRAPCGPLAQLPWRTLRAQPIARRVCQNPSCLIMVMKIMRLPHVWHREKTRNHFFSGAFHVQSPYRSSG
jgi:hypothetical protein